MSESSNQGQSSPAPAEALQQQTTSPVVPVPLSTPSQSQHGSTTTSPVPSNRSSTPDLQTHPQTRYNETVIANRIFVGGITYDTNDVALKEYFSKFGHVKEAKIISDRAGVSKGYGFITFETPEEALRIINDNSNNLIFRDKKLNVAKAVKRQQNYPKHVMEPIPMANGTMIQSPHGYSFCQHYQNGCAYYDPILTAPISPHAQPPPPTNLYQPYPIPFVMQPPPLSPQYIPAATQAPQYSAPPYPQQQQQPPAPNTQHWNAPAGQFRWMVPPQSPPMTAPLGMVPMYPGPPPGEVIYQPNPYHQAEAMNELPVEMITGQAENAVIPAGMDSQAAMNRSYVADMYQESANVGPRVNNLKMSGPKKPYINRGGRPPRPQLRHPRPGMNSGMSNAGISILAKDESKMDCGASMLNSPPPEK